MTPQFSRGKLDMSLVLRAWTKMISEYQKIRKNKERGTKIKEEKGRKKEKI